MLTLFPESHMLFSSETRSKQWHIRHQENQIAKALPSLSWAICSRTRRRPAHGSSGISGPTASGIARIAAACGRMKRAAPILPTAARIAGGYFSVKTGTIMDNSRLPLRKWVFAIYLEMTSLKGVSSMKLHRDIGVTQKSAWYMLHRIREVWSHGEPWPFSGPVEIDGDILRR